MSTPDAVLRVALTGGIATGKSYVRQRLDAAGIPTIDADHLAREAIAPGSAGFRAVIAHFGRAVLSDAGAIDRQKLAAIVFADADARRSLEAIVHPDVYQRITTWYARLAANGYRGPAVADIPLLFETGHAGDFDRVVVVACDPARQLERLRARDGLDGETATRRLAAQWPIDAKVARADIVIRTDGTFADTDTQVRQLVERLQRDGTGAVPV